MPDIDEFIPPAGYDWIWWLVLPVFLVLLVAWILLSKRFARVPAAEPVTLTDPEPRFEPRPDAATFALGRIEDVAKRARLGELTTREAHVELSAIIREFGWDRTGVDARTMTLAELRASKLPRVADAVATFYPIAFAKNADPDVDRAVSTARDVVERW